MKSKCDSGIGKMERKTVEKNRRIQMKTLCLKLASLIPKQYTISSKDMVSQIDHLDQATSYIISLQASIEKMKQRKNFAKVGIVEESSSSNECEDGGTGATAELRLPVVEVRHQDSSLEVVLVTGLDRRFVFHEVISVLEEEGAHVVNANFSVVGEKTFHTIHSQAPSSSLIGDSYPSRLTERLKLLIR